MTHVLLALLISTLAAAQTQARIEGQVTNAAGGILSKATLRLQGANPSKSTNYAAESDASGNFVFENVEPGSYTLSAERSGYVRGLYNVSLSNSQGVFSLSAGQSLQGIAIKLSPQAVITGRVTDQDGEPMSKARVTAYRRIYQAGHWQLQPSTAATTALDGTFQIGGLPAGRYYLGAEDSQASVMEPAKEEPGREGPESRYVMTFHPGALDPATAVPVEVGAGMEAGRIDIRMRRERVHRIRGKAVNTLSGAPATNIALGCAPARNDASLNIPGSRMNLVRGVDGFFEFSGLLPGTYVISTQGGVQLNGRNLFPDTGLVARRIVNVGDKNVDDVILQLAPPAEVAGTIRMDGTTAAGVVATVGLIALEGQTRNNSQFVQSKNDGTILIPGVGPNVYRVAVGGLPAGTYVKSIRCSGQDVTKAALDLTAGAGGNLEIIVSPDAASVTGTVRNDKGDPSAGVLVTLWERGSSGVAEFVRNSATDQNGGFRFQSLPPGEYRIAAWEQIEPNMANVPEFRGKFETQAAAVHLTPKSHESVDVKLVTRDVIEIEAAKLR